MLLYCFFYVTVFAMGNTVGLGVARGGEADPSRVECDLESGLLCFRHVEKTVDLPRAFDWPLRGDVCQSSIRGYLHIETKAERNLGWIGLCSLSEPFAGEPDGIEREYESGAKLSKEEEDVVIQLAKKRGIKKIAKIGTHRIEPTPNFEIRVYGMDTMVGRDVSYDSLSIMSKKWSFPGARPGPGDIRIGDFWAGMPFTVRQKILKVGGAEYRVDDIQNITIDECELILGRLLAEQFVVTPNAKFGIEEIQWRRPMVIRKKKDGTIVASFSHKGTSAGFTEVNIRILHGHLEVTPFAMAIP